MTTANLDPQGTLPLPAPGLIGLHRVREPGEPPVGLVCLDRNERQRPLPAWFMQHLHDRIQSSLLTSYPIADDLYRELSVYTQLAPQQLLLTAGSDAAIKAIYQAYVRPSDRIVILDPSYAMYPVYAQMFQAEVVRVPFDAALELDAMRLLASIVPGVRLVMLANPNQPTATLLPESLLIEVAERAGRAGALLAIDEAYYPFSRTTVLPYLERFPHLLLVRTFSKAAGMAGLRIGFAAGHPEVIANLFKVRSVHDINSVAIELARLALTYPEVIDEYVAEVEAGGRLLTERAQALGLKPLPTCTNFMLIRVPPDVQLATLIARLRTHGYLVKGPFDAPCLADCIRVTLGPPELMAAFADALTAALEGKTS